MSENQLFFVLAVRNSCILLPSVASLVSENIANTALDTTLIGEIR